MSVLPNLGNCPNKKSHLSCDNIWLLVIFAELTGDGEYACYSHDTDSFGLEEPEKLGNNNKATTHLNLPSHESAIMAPRIGVR